MSPRVTVEQIDERVRSAVPVGSSVSQVIAFIDSIKIDSLKIVRNEYLPGLPDDNLEHIPANIERATVGYLVAAIVNVERDDLAAYNIDIYFYFGEDGKLIYYTVKKHGTVP